MKEANEVPQASCRWFGTNPPQEGQHVSFPFIYILHIFHSLLLLLHIQLANEGLQRADKKTQALGRGQQLQQTNGERERKGQLYRKRYIRINVCVCETGR